MGNQQVVGVDPELAGVADVEGVLGVDEGRHSPHLLGFGDDMQGQGGFARRLRTEDFDDPAPGHSADAQGDVKAERAGGNGHDARQGGAFAEPHDASLAELFFYLADGQVDGPVAVGFRHVNPPERVWCSILRLAVPGG